MKYVIALVILSLTGCATSYTSVGYSDGTTIKTIRNSLLRRGPFNTTVTLPTANGNVKVKTTGTDEEASGNLVLLGAAVGAAVGGPLGATLGGAAGMGAEAVKNVTAEDVVEAVTE